MLDRPDAALFREAGQTDRMCVADLIDALRQLDPKAPVMVGGAYGGFVDVRMLGVARGVSMSALHRLVPFGIAGYAMCAITGSLFVVTAPGQYLYNPAIQTKLALMALAGVNMAVFYLTTSRAVATLGPDDMAPMRARLIGFISLACWLGVITAGRVVTFFRPPEFWCLWCVAG